MKHNHSCMFNHELLASYAARSISPAERVKVEQHLSECDDCRREIKELENVWLALDSWQENVETAKPRLNDFRLRLDAVRKKPSLRETLRSKWDTLAAPFRMMPATPVLATIVAGLFVYVGVHTQWGGQSAAPTVSPSLASTQPTPKSIGQETLVAAMPSVQEPYVNQINNWDSLVQNTSMDLTRRSNVFIRMATDGLDYGRYANFPNKEILSNYATVKPLRPASMQVMKGELVRLE